MSLQRDNLQTANAVETRRLNQQNHALLGVLKKPCARHVNKSPFFFA